jgi:hypothetical protein
MKDGCKKEIGIKSGSLEQGGRNRKRPSDGLLCLHRARRYVESGESRVPGCKDFSCFGSTLR